MKRLLSTLALSSLLATTAFAETAKEPQGGMMHGPGMGMHESPPPGDCSKAPDTARCKANQAALEACKDLKGMERRECMEEKMPAPDCAKAPNPEQCQKHHAAHQACKDKPVGPVRHQCVMEKMAQPG